MKEKIVKCVCGEKFLTDGWNIKEKYPFGNAYHYKSTSSLVIKYTRCKCGEEVILSTYKKPITL